MINLKKTSIAVAGLVLIIYGGLIISLIWFLDGERLFQSLFSERTLFSVSLSLVTATIATLLALFLAIPAAYALSRYSFVGKGIIETVLEFPIVVSPAALGAIILIFFNNPLGKWLQTHVVYFVFSFSGIVLAQFITILGLATRMLKTAFDEVPIELEITARTLGGSPRHVFFTITLPLARNGLGAAFILTWAKAFGEFGATLMVAGSMAMHTETLPIAIFMRLSSADIEGTVALIIILISIGLTALYTARRLLRRTINV